MSRHAIISKLPSARSKSGCNEAKESMNCQSCRKRKIKCSRTRPTCNSCDAFRCECIYDAIPKKRGPKTEVLEDLLKRIDCLEKRLEDGNAPPPPLDNGPAASIGEASGDYLAGEGIGAAAVVVEDDQPNVYLSPPSSKSEDVARKKHEDRILSSPSLLSFPGVCGGGDGQGQDSALVTHLVDVFLQRVNGKPYSIFHEGTFRQDLRNGNIPSHLLNAVCAVGVRFSRDQESKSAQEHSMKFAGIARSQVDADEPTLENLQTMLLLSLVYFAMGYGKKCFMQSGSAARMALALNLHRELPPEAEASPLQREVRRRVFWSCYLMDRFTVCGSKRPPLLSDKSIILRLPSTEDSFITGKPLESPFFSDSGQQFLPTPNGSGTALCVDIVRVLGKTIRYIQQGGVKGDSHFPWHASSNLSKIRNELNVWASISQDAKPLGGRSGGVHGQPSPPDATCFFLGVCIYHLIHCLMYRSFLPVNLNELSGNGTQQAWKMKAMNICFKHANALTELINVAAVTEGIEWPAFAGYCMVSVATVQLHGAYYYATTTNNNTACSNSSSGTLAFASCRDNLRILLRQLLEMQPRWTCVKHQFGTLRKIYACHSKLVRSFHSTSSTAAAAETSASTVFHLNDFFDRYNGETFETGHVSFASTTATYTEGDDETEDMHMNLSFINNIFSEPTFQSDSSQSPKFSPSSTEYFSHNDNNSISNDPSTPQPKRRRTLIHPENPTTSSSTPMFLSTPAAATVGGFRTPPQPEITRDENKVHTHNHSHGPFYTGTFSPPPPPPPPPPPSTATIFDSNHPLLLSPFPTTSASINQPTHHHHHNHHNRQTTFGFDPLPPRSLSMEMFDFSATEFPSPSAAAAAVTDEFGMETFTRSSSNHEDRMVTGDEAGEQDPLLSMLAEMAERDCGGLGEMDMDGGLGGGGGGGGGGNGSWSGMEEGFEKGLDMWM